MENKPVYKTILKRRSIRKFLNKPVSREIVNHLLHAAMAAPSACNLQPWAFIVVDDVKMLEALKNVTNQGKYNAPLCIVICGINKHIPWQDESWREDCACALQNIMLTCVENDLASVVVGGFNEKELCELLDIPSDVYPMCILEIGYPAYTLPELSWYTEDAVYYQKYDQNRPRKLRNIKMLEEDIKNGII